MKPMHLSAKLTLYPEPCTRSWHRVDVTSVACVTHEKLLASRKLVWTPSFFLIAHTFWLLKRPIRTIICFHVTVGKSGTELCMNIGELLVSTM